MIVIWPFVCLSGEIEPPSQGDYSQWWLIRGTHWIPSHKHCCCFPNHSRLRQILQKPALKKLQKKKKKLVTHSKWQRRYFSMPGSTNDEPDRCNGPSCFEDRMKNETTLCFRVLKTILNVKEIYCSRKYSKSKNVVQFHCCSCFLPFGNFELSAITHHNNLSQCFGKKKKIMLIFSFHAVANGRAMERAQCWGQTRKLDDATAGQNLAHGHLVEPSTPTTPDPHRPSGDCSYWQFFNHLKNFTLKGGEIHFCPVVSCLCA